MSGGKRPDLAHTILTITNNGSGNMRVTTAGPYSENLGGFPSVTIAGTSVAGYNTSHIVGAAISTTVFDLNSAFTAPATGGTWTLA